MLILVSGDGDMKINEVQTQSSLGTRSSKEDRYLNRYLPSKVDCVFLKVFGQCVEPMMKAGASDWRPCKRQQ